VFAEARRTAGPGRLLTRARPDSCEAEPLRRDVLPPATEQVSEQAADATLAEILASLGDPAPGRHVVHCARQHPAEFVQERAPVGARVARRFVELVGVESVLQLVWCHRVVLARRDPGVDMPPKSLAAEAVEQTAQAANCPAPEQSSQHTTRSSTPRAEARRRGTTLAEQTTEDATEAASTGWHGTGRTLLRPRVLHELVGQQRHSRQLHPGRQPACDAAVRTSTE
jgi:hypothetical protein